MHGTGDTLTIEQAAVMGGVGFERPLLRAMPVADARTIPGARPVPLSFLSVKGLVPELSDDAEATPEGYVQWRDRLLKERGFLTAWLFQTLDPREVATFAGLALALCAITWIRARRAKQPLTRTEWVASLVDLAMVTLVLTLVAVYPDTYQHRTGPFTGWHVAVGVYVLIFALADRAGRVGITAVVMTIVMVWTAITPGLGEVARGWTPAQLALPPLEGSGGGPLSTDTIYTLQALQEGLSLCRSVDPHYAWYPLLWLLSVLGVVLEVRVIGERERAARADRAGAAEPHAEGS
jgi:hypothetical protein